jgi:hypothetical protein
MASREMSELWKALRPITILAAAVLAAAIFIMDLRAPKEVATTTPADSAAIQARSQ